MTLVPVAGCYIILYTLSLLYSTNIPHSITYCKEVYQDGFNVFQSAPIDILVSYGVINLTTLTINPFLLILN